MSTLSKNSPMSLLRDTDTQRFTRLAASTISAPRVTVDQVSLYSFSTTVYYVDVTNGSDYNTGLSADDAFEGLEHALDVIPPVGHGVYTIILAEGTYNLAEGFSNRNYVGNHPNGFATDDAQGHVIITIQGNTNAPQNYIIDNNPIYNLWENRSSTVVFNLYGLTLQNCIDAATVRDGAVMNLQSIVIQNFSGVGIKVATGGTCNLLSGGTGITIQQPSQNNCTGIWVAEGGVLNNEIDAANHIITGSNSFDLDYGVRVQGNGSIYNAENCSTTLDIDRIAQVGILVEEGGHCTFGCSLDITAVPITESKQGWGIRVRPRSELSLEGAGNTYAVTRFNMHLLIEGRFVQSNDTNSSVWTHSGDGSYVNIAVNASSEANTFGDSGFGNVLGVARSDVNFIDDEYGTFFGQDARYIKTEVTGTVSGSSYTIVSDAFTTGTPIPESIEVYADSTGAGGTSQLYYRVFGFSYDRSTQVISGMSDVADTTPIRVVFNATGRLLAPVMTA